MEAARAKRQAAAQHEAEIVAAVERLDALTA
jgi:hypothetical protein